VLYGSRAKGDFRPFSDVDLVLVGEKLNRADLRRIILALDDSPLPYRFDVSIFHDLSNPDLIAHIERVGIVLYRKG
ncbi:MAG: nucleotidyltransferase domain-containing protein, partial [Alistipes sp.]|nr:nucleotidyltransferase domain-containing protein [Alistipes sp.]